MTIQIGQMNQLTVSKIVSFGAYLDGGDDWGEILLPKRYCPKLIELNQSIDVLIYFDSEDRIIATTETPKAFVNQFAYLQVKDINQNGAFLDWGIAKDVLVPYSLQASKMRLHAYYLVYLYLDPESDRITASSRFTQFIKKETSDYQVGQAVDLIIYKETDLGYKAIIDHQYDGLLYKDQVFSILKIGMQLKGFIQKIREDHKIDLSLQSHQINESEQLSDEILKRLKANHGFLKLGDHSDPKLIYQTFAVSKKKYKRALAFLYKKRLIEIKSTGVYLK